MDSATRTAEVGMPYSYATLSRLALLAPAIGASLGSRFGRLRK